MENNKFCITFSGPVGCSKTPISNYLSTKLSLSIFNNDAIRSEVIEDLGFFDSKEHIKRRDIRLEDTMLLSKSFICDVSVDREWGIFKKRLKFYNYNFLIISIDLSKDFLVKLYKSKNYLESLERVDELIFDHNNFLDKYSDDIILHIDDKSFVNRLEISYNEILKFFK